MAAYDAFYRLLIAEIAVKNVVSRFAMERVKASIALPFQPLLQTWTAISLGERILRATPIIENNLPCMIISPLNSYSAGKLV